jgi:hypothetical protein
VAVTVGKTVSLLENYFAILFDKDVAGKVAGANVRLEICVDLRRIDLVLPLDSTRRAKDEDCGCELRCRHRALLSAAAGFNTRL